MISYHQIQAHTKYSYPRSRSLCKESLSQGPSHYHYYYYYYYYLLINYYITLHIIMIANDYIASHIELLI